MRILTQLLTIISVFTVRIPRVHSLPLDDAKLIRVEYTVIERETSCYEVCQKGGRCDQCDLANGTPGFCCNPFDFTSGCNNDMVNAVRATPNRNKSVYQCVVPNIYGLSETGFKQGGFITDQMYKEAFKFIWPYWHKSGTESGYKRKENYRDLIKVCE